MVPYEDVWMKDFDERQQKQIRFAEGYDTDEFRHGANGHNDMLIEAKMARKLREYESALRERGYFNESLSY